jgi:hypothetical protein
MSALQLYTALAPTTRTEDGLLPHGWLGYRHSYCPASTSTTRTCNLNVPRMTAGSSIPPPLVATAAHLLRVQMWPVRKASKSKGMSYRVPALVIEDYVRGADWKNTSLSHCVWESVFECLNVCTNNSWHSPDPHGSASFLSGAQTCPQARCLGGLPSHSRQQPNGGVYGPFWRP